ncbi:MAG: tetratricopeptide repeat protein [Planctomycetota bacterium]|jgi:tetratricopeptide (TPR) repeat protein
MLRRTFLLTGALVKRVLIGVAAMTIISVPVLNAKAADASSLASTDKRALYGRIRQMVRALEYPDKLASELLEMVDSWKDTQGQPALATLKAILANSRESCIKGELSKTQLAVIEKNIVSQLARTIKRQISYKRDFFELSSTIRSRKTNCCGYSQLLYILGNSIDLSIWPARVIEPVEGPMATVPRHMANIARLADGTTIILDLTRTGSIGASTVTIGQYQSEVESGQRRSQRCRSTAGSIHRASGARSIAGACFIEQLAARGHDSQTDIGRIQTLDRNELIAELYFSRGTLYHSSGRSAKAIKAYSKAIKANPKCARAYNNRGSIYLTAGRYKKSISNFDEAIGLNPEFAHAYYNRASARLALGLYSKAICDYTRAIELGAELERTFLKRGSAYLESGEYGRAVADYTRAIELDPKSSRAYYGRGTAYAMLTDRARAREDLRKAVRLDPALKTHVEQVSRQFELYLILG